MVIMAVNSVKYGSSVSYNKKISPLSFKGESKREFHIFDSFVISDISDNKVGTAFLLTPKDNPKMTILVKEGAKIVVGRRELDLCAEIRKAISQVKKHPSFRGRLYGSVNVLKHTRKMERAYKKFYQSGMYDKVVSSVRKFMHFKEDYNFFTPTDGEGTRFADWTNMLGGTSKPAAELPMTLNGKPLNLINLTQIIFARTGMLEKIPEFIKVEGGHGSAYAFLEGLRTGKIPTDKPLVFCWGDNFSDINVSKLIKYHERNGAGITVLGMMVPEERIHSLGSIHFDSGSWALSIKKLVEKPQTREDILPSAISASEDKYLASIGPFVLSKDVLKHLKAEYRKNPEAFKNAKGEVDFSSKVLAPIIDSRSFKVLAYIKPHGESWSDAGKTTDLIELLHQIKAGGFRGLLPEIRRSVIASLDKNGAIYMNPASKRTFKQFCAANNIRLGGNVVVSIKP